jgi:hypothetical protein
VSCFASGLRNLSSYYTNKYYTLSSWRIVAFDSTLLLRTCQTLQHTYARALETLPKCRLSSTTRCRRRCEVSTSWTDPIPTYSGGNTWRKRQQRVGYVPVERFKSKSRGILSAVWSHACLLPAIKDETPRYVPGWYSHKAAHCVRPEQSIQYHRRLTIPFR